MIYPISYGFILVTNSLIFQTILASFRLVKTLLQSDLKN